MAMTTMPNVNVMAPSSQMAYTPSLMDGMQGTPMGAPTSAGTSTPASSRPAVCGTVSSQGAEGLADDPLVTLTLSQLKELVRQYVQEYMQDQEEAQAASEPQDNKSHPRVQVSSYTSTT